MFLKWLFKFGDFYQNKKKSLEAVETFVYLFYLLVVNDLNKRLLALIFVATDATTKLGQTSAWWWPIEHFDSLPTCCFASLILTNSLTHSLTLLISGVFV